MCAQTKYAIEATLSISRFIPNRYLRQVAFLLALFSICSLVNAGNEYPDWEKILGHRFVHLGGKFIDLRSSGDIILHQRPSDTPRLGSVNLSCIEYGFISENDSRFLEVIELWTPVMAQKDANSL